MWSWVAIAMVAGAFVRAGWGGAWDFGRSGVFLTAFAFGAVGGALWWFHLAH